MVMDRAYPHDAVTGLLGGLRDELSNSAQGDVLIPALAHGYISLAISSNVAVNWPVERPQPLPLSLRSAIHVPPGDDLLAMVNFLQTPFMEWSQQQVSVDEADRCRYRSELEIWREGRKILQQSIRQVIKRGESTDGQQRALCVHNGQEPLLPVDHSLFLHYSMMHKKLGHEVRRPTVCWTNDGADSRLPKLRARGVVIQPSFQGGHAENSDQASMLFVIPHGCYQSALKRRGRSLRENGWDGRLLHAHVPAAHRDDIPLSVDGAGPIYGEYRDRVMAQLDEMNERFRTGAEKSLVFLEPPAMRYMESCDEHYRRVMRNPENADCRDALAKASENIVRIAVASHVFEGREGGIARREVECAEEIVRYHLSVYAWLHEPPQPVPSKAELRLWDDADALCAWLVRDPDHGFSSTENRYVADSLCMTVDRLRKAVVCLKENGLVRVVGTGGKAVVRLRR